MLHLRRLIIFRVFFVLDLVASGYTVSCSCDCGTAIRFAHYTLSMVRMNLLYLVCTRPATNRLITYHLHAPRSLFDGQYRSLLDHLPVLHILTASTIYITGEYAKINQPGFGRSTFVACNTAWISCGPSLNVGFLISGTSGGLLVVLTEVWLLTAFGFNHYVIDPQ